MLAPRNGLLGMFLSVIHTSALRLRLFNLSSPLKVRSNDVLSGPAPRAAMKFLVASAKVLELATITQFMMVVLSQVGQITPVGHQCSNPR